MSRPVRWSAIVGGGLLTAGMFVVDLLLPLGIAGGIPYIAPVLLAMWLPDRRLILAVAGVCSLLALAGIWTSPAGADPSIFLPNRILSVAAIWTVAAISYQRRATESALAQSEAASRTVLDTTADGILMLDERGRVLAANPATENIFGIDPADVVGRPFSELLAGEYASLFGSSTDNFLRTRASRPITHELDGRRGDGQIFPIEAVFVPIIGGDDARYTATVRDITDRRLLEQHLLRTSHQERRAIGHSLHEDLGQALTGVTLIGRQLARRLEDRDLVEAREAADLAVLLQEMDRQALGLYRSIAPLDAAEHFHSAVVEMLTEAGSKYGAELDIRGESVCAPDDAFRAAQLFEALRGLVTRLVDEGGLKQLFVVTFSEDGTDRIEIHFAEAKDADALSAILRPAMYRAKLIEARVDVAPSSVVCRWVCATTSTIEENGSSHLASVN